MKECTIVPVQNQTINRFWCQCPRRDYKERGWGWRELNTSCACNLFSMHLQCEFFMLSRCTVIWTGFSAISISLDVKLNCLITAARNAAHLAKQSFKLCNFPLELHRISFVYGETYMWISWPPTFVRAPESFVLASDVRWPFSNKLMGLRENCS
jgi:hypothetical protein